MHTSLGGHRCRTLNTHPSRYGSRNAKEVGNITQVRQVGGEVGGREDRGGGGSIIPSLEEFIRTQRILMAFLIFIPLSLFFSLSFVSAILILI